MGFTLGGVNEALDREVKVGLAVDADGTGARRDVLDAGLRAATGRSRLDAGPDAAGGRRRSGQSWSS